MRKKNIIIASLVFILPFIGIAQDFEVAPVQLFFSADPGESQVKVVNIKNHSSKATSFIMSLSDYEITSKGSKEVMPANSSKYSIANWISISPSFFEIGPNSEMQISISVQPPIDDYGSRWGMINVRPAKEKTSFEAGEELSAGVNISSRIVIDVYQTSRSNKNLKAKIDQLREIKSDEPDKRRFSAIVTNLSDIIIPCKVHLIASNLKTTREHHFPPVQFQAYPKNTQKIILKMPKKLAKGRYALAAVLDYGSNVNLEGTQMIIEVK